MLDCNWPPLTILFFGPKVVCMSMLYSHLGVEPGTHNPLFECPAGISPEKLTENKNNKLDDAIRSKICKMSPSEPNLTYGEKYGIHL